MENRTNDSKPRLVFSVRFMLAILGFMLTAIQYMQRTDMSVGIVCMVNNTFLDLQKLNATQRISIEGNDSLSSVESTSLDSVQCYASGKGNNTKKFDGPFEWDKKIQGIILSSFFYGYTVTQIAGAWLALKFGAKIVLVISILIGSVLTLLTPFAARISYVVLMICRFVIGVSHGVVWSGLGTLWPHWVPPAERSTILGISNAGSQIGNVFTLSVGGLLCEYGFDGGWPSIFYLIGLIGLVWCLLWFALITDSPSKHKFISDAEKNYILDETKDSVSAAKNDKKKTPWAKILSSKAVYGMMITHTCSNFGTYLFLTQLPTYMNEILKFDITSNGTLSSLPYLGFWLFTILSGIFSDKIIQKKVFSRTVVRKIFNTAGFIVPMFSVIGLIFVTCRVPYIGVLFITLGLTFSGLTYGAGFLVNANDIGGIFSGIVFGISNTIGTISGIVAPYLVGVLTKNKTQEEWQLVFIITAVVYCIGMLAFILLASGETQEWAKLTKLDDGEEKGEEMKPLKK